MSYKKPLLRFSLFLLPLFTSFLFSCKKDTVITSSGAKLAFSADSVLFDTVFTSVGSTVRAFLVRNNNSQPIVISSIKLQGNGATQFKINVDGTPLTGASLSNIKIPAKDSIFVFVTVTINPTVATNPFVINDSLVFTTNGNVQYVFLQAYGQNANYFTPNKFLSSGPAFSYLPCSQTTWTPAKPYVIIGYLWDTCNLVIQPGTQIYLHNNAVLYIGNGASLTVGQSGGPSNPVVFQGDRLEPEYKYVPGQWGEIWLSPGSINNVISWAIIKNGTIGIEADTVGTSGYSGPPTLKIDHTIIKSMSQFGLLGLDSYIVGNNDLIEDCQYFDLDLSYGGKYRFYQSTFANYWSYSQRQTSLLLINNYYTDVNSNIIGRDMDSAFFDNCIIYGSAQNEITTDFQGNGKHNYYFSYCDLASTTYTGANYSNCTTANPDFKGTGEPPLDNYHSNNLSNLVGTGTYGVYAPDLTGQSVAGTPFMGAYQE